MLGRRDAGDLDRIRILSDDHALERQIGSLARLQLDESSSKIVGPAAKGPICVMLLSRPFQGYLRRASRSNALDSFLLDGCLY
jgi:adenine/guanine phosphoribosyltransferase-like PRPP-binding protein